MTITVGVISDTHISSPSESIDQRIKNHFQDVDLIVHAGDLVILDVLEELKEIAPVKAVHGNMCHSEVRRALPSKLVFELEGVTVGVTHGLGSPFGFINRMDAIAQREGCDVFISGHSHHATIEYRGNRLHVNPGKGGKSSWSSSATIAKLIINGKKAEATLFKI